MYRIFASAYLYIIGGKSFADILLKEMFGPYITWRSVRNSTHRHIYYKVLLRVGIDA